MDSSVELRPGEISLFADLIDYRDRMEAAGRHDEEYLVAFAGNDGDLTHPGLEGSRPVSTRTLVRFERLGLLDVTSRTDAAMAFVLADGFRSTWSRIRDSSRAQEPSFSQPAAGRTPVPKAPAPERGIFLSVAETQKVSLARPFRSLLAASGLRGFIVSDEPLPDGAFTPEEKVDAYLELSDAVVVFATGDLEAGEDRYTRPNIADEIGRARSKPHLRNRVCVLKERGVSLPSNIDPAYESLDPAHPEEGYRRASQQLRAWGFAIESVPEGASSADRLPHPEARPPADPKHDIPPETHDELLSHAQSVLPPRESSVGQMALTVVLTAGPQTQILRPAELEDPALAKELTQLLLFGTPGLFDASEGTRPAMSNAALMISQTRSYFAVDAEVTMIVVRPITRQAGAVGLTAVIDEDVRADIADVMRFASQVLARLDPGRRLAYVTPLVALSGASYGAWRSRAEQAASPNSMEMNITGASRPLAHLTRPAVDRASIDETADEIAEDLTVLLRRAATARS